MTKASDKQAPPKNPPPKKAPQYKVLSPLKYDRRYEVGDKVAMPAKAAAPLVALGRLAKA